jgi:MerR family transcriptional regulator, light-induced transcriptional regulator
VREFVEALIDADQSRARSVAQDTFQATNSRTSVFADLIHPAAHQIGELWYVGQIGVAVEHAATAVASAIIENLPPTPSDRPVLAGTSCLLAAVGQEQHTIGLRVLQLALEDDGWSVEQLGGQTPVGETVALVARRRPALLGLSASYLPSVRSIRDTIQQVQVLGIPMLVGGPAFIRVPGLWRRVAASGFGIDARVGVRLARRLVGQ